MLTLALNADGAIAPSDLEIPQQSAGAPTVTELQFARFELRSEKLQYIGVELERLPYGAVLIVFGPRASVELDRALVERCFAKVMTERVPAGAGAWVQFDHSGHVLKSGEEILQLADLKQTLERRYQGIHISAVTESLVIARSGRRIEDAAHLPLHLHCARLTTNSSTH